MTKTYLNPELQVVKLQTIGMLATSNPEDGFAGGGKGDLESGVTSGNLGRGYDFDDED